MASATFLQTYAGILDTTDLIAHCRRYFTSAVLGDAITDDGTILTLAEHATGAAPIGYTVLTPCDLPIARADDIELKRIYTLSATHGSGLGPALLEQAIRDAAAAGAARMLLGVYHGNARARRFYEREGFTIVGERPFTVGTVTHIDPVYARPL